MGGVVITFAVLGTPRSQGSKRGMSACGQVATVCTRCHKPHIVKIILFEQENENLAVWRSLVDGIARQAMFGKRKLTGPVSLRLIFTWDRPPAHYRTGKFSHLLRDDAPIWPDRDPDQDKLTRAVCDALTGVVWGDDNQVVDCHVTKAWAQDAPPVEGALPKSGVRIMVSEMLTGQAPQLELLAVDDCPQ